MKLHQRLVEEQQSKGLGRALSCRKAVRKLPVRLRLSDSSRATFSSVLHQLPVSQSQPREGPFCVEDGEEDTAAATCMFVGLPPPQSDTLHCPLACTKSAPSYPKPRV